MINKEKMIIIPQKRIQ